MKLVVRACGDAVLKEPAPVGGALPTVEKIGPIEADALSAGGPFRLGGHGLHLLVSFLQGPMLILGPTLQLLVKYLGPVGILENPPKGRSRVTDGHSFSWQQPTTAETAFTAALAAGGASAAEEVRVLVAELVEEVQGVLGQFYAGAVGAQWVGFDHFCSARPGEVDAAPALLSDLVQSELLSGPELERVRISVKNRVVLSHRRQLGVLEKVLRIQLEHCRGLVVRVKRR